MGEIADMMLDGILDANGEYTGHDYGYPVYPKGWFKNKRNNRYKNPLAGIHLFIQGGRNAEQWISKKIVRKVLLQYAEKIGFRPIGDHELAKDWDESIEKIISKDFQSFRTWYKSLQ